MARTRVVSSDLTPDWLDKYSGVMSEINRQLIHGLREPGKGLALEHLQAVVEHRNPFGVEVPQLSAVSDPIVFYQKFYLDFCGLEVDFSGARVPELQGDFTLVLGIPQGLTPNRMFEACSQRFLCRKFWDDMDVMARGLNEREPTASYFIRVRDRQEADEELKNLSANDIKEKGLKTETLLERLVHGAVFFARTGEHLDVVNVTLCAGSRLQDGHVPRAHWFRGRFRVYWYSPGDSSGLLRAREVVSF